MISTAEFAHRTPGITVFRRRGWVVGRNSIEIKRMSPIVIEGLKLTDISEFTVVMHKSIDSRTDIFPDDSVAQAKAKKQAKNRRSEDFYREVLADPKKTVLVARDLNGKIVGGLEGEESYDEEDKVDGQKIAYVLWVGVDPDSKIKGVASSLYSAYEEKAVGVGATFLLANVDNKNLPSRELHTRNGFNYPYLEKIGSDTKWHAKQIGALEKNTELPITESDYLSVRLAGVVLIVSKEMSRQGLGRVVIAVPTDAKTDHLLLDSSGNPLYNLIFGDERLRMDFEVIMEKIAGLVNCNPGEIGPVFEIIQQAVRERSSRRLIIKN